uniref:Uncharacterized protein n=1 Tax=Arundo donax TaxID=35708 RepID=A0A0A8Y4I1_ARUDO
MGSGNHPSLHHQLMIDAKGRVAMECLTRRNHIIDQIISCFLQFVWK